MSKYIDAEKLIELVKEWRSKQMGFAWDAVNEVLKIIASVQQEQDMGEVSDCYHTFNELYYYRMLYNAAFFNILPKEWVHKSKRHHTGEECFGGGWFIVMANLPTGQISNHYELKDWDLFKVAEKDFADEWDGHTPQEAANRLYEYLQHEQPEVDFEEDGMISEHELKVLKLVAEKDGTCLMGLYHKLKSLHSQSHWKHSKEQPEVDLNSKVTFDCISKKVTMSVQELINYYIDRECCDAANECGF